MIKKVRNKKETWKNLEEAKDYLSTRKIFQDMNQEIFHSFLIHGLISSHSTKNLQEKNGIEEEVKLVFSSQAELNLIYSVQIDLPFLLSSNKNERNVHQYHINKSLKGYFLYSNQFDFLDRSDIRYAKQLFPSSFKFIGYNNTHFWPFFQPDEFSNQIVELILEEKNNQ